MMVPENQQAASETDPGDPRGPLGFYLVQLESEEVPQLIYGRIAMGSAANFTMQHNAQETGCLIMTRSVGVGSAEFLGDSDYTDKHGVIVDHYNAEVAAIRTGDLRTIQNLYRSLGAIIREYQQISYESARKKVAAKGAEPAGEPEKKRMSKRQWHAMKNRMASAK